MSVQPYGIPTMYGGIQFRSRLEARWACFFDLIGWRWDYEPFDMDGYIPDFLIYGKREMTVEVKPLGLVSQLVALASETPLADRDLLTVGIGPLPEDDIDGGMSLWQIGGMVEWDDEVGTAGEAAAAYWHVCTYPGCRSLSCHHSTQWFASRPCGHYDGDHYLGFADPTEILGHWAKACNATQWKKP